MTDATPHARPLEPLPDATGLAAALAAGQCTAVELTAACLDTIARRDDEYGAFTYVAAEAALAQAAAADERRRRGAPAGPLDGLPVALKANIAVRGWPHTGGYAFRRDEIAAADAEVVARLRAAGAVFVGLTNMDEGALGATSTNPWYRTTRNPVSPAYSVGGSSGGSAAAVAARACAFALGTDTIGSLRIPAAWCGIAALKPTFGVVPVHGVLPVQHRFDHVGPLTRSVRDLGLALGVIAAAPFLPPRAPGCRVRLGAARGFDALEPESAVLDGYARGLGALQELGHTLVPVDLESWQLTQARRAIFALAEIEMARRHAARLASAPESFSPELRSMLAFGARQAPADLTRFERRIAALQATVLAALREVDALVMPTVPETAFRLDGPPSNDSADLTCIASAGGLPAVSLPIPAAGSLPIGIQLVGAAGLDLELIRLATELEAALRPAPRD